MKVLVIGSGGREHVLTWKIAQSPKVDKIYCAPGNGGMAKIAECVDLTVEDIDGCVKFAREKGIDLTVVGPEVPLVMGMTDAFEKEGMRVFGPNAKCAEFEGSKAFTKDFLLRHNIPTAAYKEYTDLDEVMKDIGVYGFPMVIKADGLAAGKGVLIVENEQEAKDGINMIMADHEFGEAGDKVVVEEFLTGREASMLCFVDGNIIVPMESAQDYKRAYDNDEGLNTGGMGTYSPNVLFDVRFGDPEAQSVLMRMDSDLVDIMEACIDGKLADCDIKWKDEAAVTVVLASGGYPGPYEKGLEITGIEDVEGCEVFHAGTALKDGRLVTAGGRVLCVSALGEDREAARAKVYSQVDKIKFDGARYRTDIAKMD